MVNSNLVSGCRYAEDAALPHFSREGLLAATNAIFEHLRLFCPSVSSLSMLDLWA